MSVFVSLLLTLRDCGRSRATLQLEVLALRHRLHVLERSRARRLRLTRLDRGDRRTAPLSTIRAFGGSIGVDLLG
jgi:hypothetical protein